MKIAVQNAQNVSRCVSGHKASHDTSLEKNSSCLRQISSMIGMEQTSKQVFSQTSFFSLAGSNKTAIF